MVVRSAVVGAGVVSRTHLTGISENPRTELVGVCDRDAERATDAATEFGTVAYDDLEEMLEGTTVDCLHVCTPVQTHVPLAKVAIERGTAALIEKPVAMTTDEVSELQAFADDHDVPVSVVHNHLYSPPLRRCRRLIGTGALGDVRSVEVVHAGKSRPDERKRGSWVRDLDGGEFEEGLPHTIYTVLGVGGYPEDDASVQAITHRNREYDDGYTYDGAQVQYRSTEGVLCTVKALTEVRPQRYVVVHGTDASVFVDLINLSVQVIDEDYTRSAVARVKKSVDTVLAQVVSTGRNVKRTVQPKVDDNWETAKYNPHYYVFDRMAKAVEYDTDVPTPLAESWWTIRLIEHIRDAATTRDRRPGAARTSAGSDGERTSSR